MLNSTLLFLRSALFYLGYFLVTLLMSLGFIVFSPLLRDRGRYLFVTTWCAFILTWLRLCCGVRYKIRGLDNIPDEPVVILSNLGQKKEIERGMKLGAKDYLVKANLDLDKIVQKKKQALEKIQ